MTTTLFITGEGTLEDESGHTLDHNTTDVGAKLPSISSLEKAVGNYSIYFAANDLESIKINNTGSDFYFGTDNFTIDYWVRFIDGSNNAHIMEAGTGSNNIWQLWHTGDSWRFYSIYDSSNVIDLAVTYAISNAVWYHVAVVRNGDLFTLYVNGTHIGSITRTYSVGFIDSPLYIGERYKGGLSFYGYMDNIRVTKGEALWTSDFNINSDLNYPLPPAYAHASSIYNVGHRGNLRGKAKQGLIRPTIKQFFMSSPDWEEKFRGYKAKSVIFDINSRYGGDNYGIRKVEFFDNNTLHTLNNNYEAYHSSTFNINYYQATFVFNSNLTKLGSAFYNGWASVKTGSPQRLIVVFDNELTFNKIIVNNYHNVGDLNSLGLKNVKITITDEVITNTTPNTSIQNGIVIFDDIFEQHTAVNEVQDWEVPLVSPSV